MANSPPTSLLQTHTAMRGGFTQDGTLSKPDKLSLFLRTIAGMFGVQGSPAPQAGWTSQSATESRTATQCWH